MSSLAIFLYGVAVMAIVATAISLILWGIHTERKDRLELEAEQAARGVGPKADKDWDSQTQRSGVTIGE